MTNVQVECGCIYGYDWHAKRWNIKDVRSCRAFLPGTSAQFDGICETLLLLDSNVDPARILAGHAMATPKGTK